MPRPSIRSIVGSTIVVCLGTAAGRPAPAQQPPAAQFEERIEVVEALVDVLVTDSQGNVVLGLRAEDFRIEVDGRPAEVTGATFYSNRRFLDSAVAAKIGVDPGAVPDQRLFIVFFDDQRIENHEASGLMARQLRAGRDLAAWLRRELLPNDLVAVVSFDSRLRIQQDFTGDLAALERAVERASRSEPPPEDWPSRRTERGDLPSLAAALPDAETVARSTAEIHKALTVLAEAAHATPGRKNLILFSRGFGQISSIGGHVPDTRYHRELVEGLNAANVAAYVVDVVPDQTRHTHEHAVTDLAAATGGLPFLDVLSFSIPLERIARETNGYYLVSARVPAGQLGPSYREVEVAVVNPEFRVKARRGFRFEVGAKP